MVVFRTGAAATAPVGSCGPAMLAAYLRRELGIENGVFGEAIK
jgi:hypothetical protein